MSSLKECGLSEEGLMVKLLGFEFVWTGCKYEDEARK